jgi:hypothetical protein
MIHVDFHIHSWYSFDSFLSPRDIVKIALKRRLSAIAVADHATTKGALEVMKEAASTDLVVIPAIELEVNGNHIMGLFVETAISAQGVDEVLDRIKEQNGISALLHPDRLCKENLKDLMNKVDVVESLNGRTRHSRNLRAYKLAHSLGKPVIAGSDAHFGFEIGCVRTIFLDASNTLEEIRKCVFGGRRVLIGRESPYFVHLLSFGMQLVKSIWRPS